MWDQSAADIADYIRIRVGHGLTPSKATLLLGTVQQFTTSVISEGTIRNQSKQKKDTGTCLLLALITRVRACACVAMDLH